MSTNNVDAPTTTVTGSYHVWSLNGYARSYADIHMKYRDAVEYVIPVRYNALSGKGEQRELFLSHARKIKNEMWAGNYTPTQISANLRKNHQANLKLDENTRTFTLNINSNDPLAQTDGGHRYGGLDLLVRGLKDQVEKATDKKEKEKFQAQLDEVMSLEVGIRVYFDGDPQKDFINLQAGRTVDAAHMLSLRIQKNVMGDPAFKLAFAATKLLAKTEGSPFQGLIRFDSKQSAKDSLVKQIPLSTVMSKSSSDLGTSLVGMAKVCADKEASFLVNCITASFKAISERAPGLLESGKVLTPIRNGGTKGSATMLLGIGMCMAQRLITLGHETPDEHDLELLVSSVKSVMDHPVDGNFSGPVKRRLMGAFARDFLGDMENLHDGIPVSLLKATSASTFDAEPLPKETKPVKQRKQKKAKAATATLPDVDSEIPPMFQADTEAFDEVQATTPDATEDEVSDESLSEIVGTTTEPVFANSEESTPWDERESVEG